MSDNIVSLTGTAQRPLVRLFDDHVPAALLEASVKMLSDSYGASYAYCSQEFSEAEARDLYGHHRRATVEQSFRAIARRFDGIEADAIPNAADSYRHTRVVAGPVVLIECRVRAPRQLVSRALFRDGYAEDSQLSLFGASPPANPGSNLFAILLHGSDYRYPDRLAFAHVAFPNRECTVYVDTIDLLHRFPDLARTVVPNVAIELTARPAPRLRPLSTEEAGDQ